MSQNTGYLRHFLACNKHDLSGFVPFYIANKRYGRVKKKSADVLLRETSSFTRHGDGIALSPALTTFAARSEALRNAVPVLASLHGNKSMYNEMYGIMETWGEDPVAEADRAAVPWFGVRAWGVHINGYVQKKDGIHLWIGKRAADRSSYAGQLDNMVGGGHPIGLTCEENLCKEAKEEAGIDPSLALTGKLAGTIDYIFERPDGLRTDTLFVYDLELPESFTPRNTDGEVEAFALMPLADVDALIRETNRFKFNCTMVITDFMIRHGYLTPECPEYGDIQKWLKR